MNTRMKQFLLGFIWLCTFLAAPISASAQDSALTFVTVDRPPFSMLASDGVTREGFSIDLTRAIAEELGREVRFERVETFSDMFDAIAQGRADGAIANISITAAREQTMDFTHPIFESGLQIMLPGEKEGASLINVIATRDVALFVLTAFGVLFIFGMLMWLLERGRQPYFDRPLREAIFPSFWWALNLVVNGGFEERVPTSRLGRVFGVLLVVSSLFIVSIFVAQITAAMTVAAISENVENLNDLEGRKTATTRSSTGESLLTRRDIAHESYDTLQEMLSDFESGKVEAIVFDGPILAWYLQTQGRGKGRLVERVFKRENYGIALPTGSPLTEEFNRALLELRESAVHDEITRQYFGN